MSTSGKGASSSSNAAVPLSVSDTIICKIIVHSKHRNAKFLKYLLHAKKSFSSSNLKLWMDLRTKGGLQAIELALQNMVDIQMFEDNASPRRRNDKMYQLNKDICVTGMSVLGNAYSLDYAARKEVASNGFIGILHKFIQKYSGWITKLVASSISESNPVVIEKDEHRTDSSCLDIVTKAVKCIANLSHDSGCRDIILKAGVGISILRILEGFNQLSFRNKASQKEKPDEVFAILDDEQKDCVKASVRAIRILSSEPFCSEEAKNHFIRFGAVITLGKVLSWSSDVSAQDDFTLDVIRALTSLTDRVRLLPSDQIEELVSGESSNVVLKTLVEILDTTPIEGKPLIPTIRCLTNLSRNCYVAEFLGRSLIFKIALEKLQHSSGKVSSDICRLMLTLTKHSSVNQCLLNNCQEISSTLSVLKSPNSQEYHRWVLQAYENVYEGTLKCLLRNGLIELLQEHLEKELESCDYEILKKKIISLENDACRVHVFLKLGSPTCQFAPVYRSDSPSYHQVQAEVKAKLEDKNYFNKLDMESSSSGIESSSPSNSPARSWASEDSLSSSIIEDRSTRRGHSQSPATSASDDEGCYSPVYSCSSSPSYSAAGPNKLEDIEDDTEMESLEMVQPLKRRKLNEGDECLFFEKKTQIYSKRSTECMKTKSKNIVSMLNILHKCTHLAPMPSNLIGVVPMLISFLVRGIVSLTPLRIEIDPREKDSEMMKLGAQSFNLAYRILKTIFGNISMFPDLIKNGAASILFRLVEWDPRLSAQEFVNQQSMETLLETLTGLPNATAGWREGYLLRSLLVGKCDEELQNIALAVPLLFRKNDHVLRNFETKGRSWSRVLDILSKTDEITSSKLQDCVLTLSTLCQTVGMKWTEAQDSKKKPQLLKMESESDLEPFMSVNEDLHGQDNLRVQFILDDGSSVSVKKEILTKASPVFSAMFDGHFIEAGEQKVNIPNTSAAALKLFVEQIILNFPSEGTFTTHPYQTQEITEDKFELSTLFEVISLSDQFLLEEIYEKTLNSLLAFYICPYSSPHIYAEAVKWGNLWKPQNRHHPQHLDLTLVILKYLLVGDMSTTSRCGAFLRIIDLVLPSILIGDVRALIDYYCTNPFNQRSR